MNTVALKFYSFAFYLSRRIISLTHRSWELNGLPLIWQKISTPHVDVIFEPQTIRLAIRTANLVNYLADFQATFEHAQVQNPGVFGLTPQALDQQGAFHGFHFSKNLRQPFYLPLIPTR